RWSEFPPRVSFQSAQAGARVNRGLRDGQQRHGYQRGEFGPGGLYHDPDGRPGNAGTTAGVEVRIHPSMPVQLPNSVWTFDGTLPPKLLMARYGESVLFRHYNALPIDPAANMGFGLHTLSTHEHNGHNPAESDGYTNAFFFPGQYYDYRWPMISAGHDAINRSASDARMGAPDGNGGIRRLPGDWREVASTHWFHDHMLDYTAQNVYKGNAAMMNLYSSVDRGNEAIADGVNLRLPSGSALDWGNRDYDVNLLIADKAWLDDGQIFFNIFNLDGFLGDRLLVNWQYHPYLDVRARRYRFRILNGSIARYLKLALVDQNNRPVPFHLVANDGNLMEHAVAFDGTRGTRTGILPTQSIGERYDIVVDFSRFAPGTRLYLVNLLEHEDGRRPEDPVPLGDVLSGRYRPQTRDDDGDGRADRWINGDPCVGKFLELRVHAYAGVDRSMNPANYTAGRRKMIPLARPSAQELAAARHRTFEFGRSGGTDEYPWTIKTDGGTGLIMDPRRVSAAPSLGELEIWRFETGGGWSHPVHVHFEEAILLSKDDGPVPEWERWARKDMFRIGPEVDGAREMEVAVRFRDFAGTYVEHCHNTQHEDHAMLLRWDLERPGQVTYLPSPIPSWDGVEYVPSIGLPTARTGDGFGPGGD
ncbi:MAG TPA: multicopper oxidase domain-containing protein, partial [Planctomycetota bacterium]